MPVRIKYLFLLAFLLLSSQALKANTDLRPYYLRCEYKENPVTDVTRPRLSWLLQSQARGQHQTAYQIRVATSPEKLAAGKADLWDSEKVSSDRTAQVEYQGKPLSSRTLCYWQVRSWDKDGQAGSWSPVSTWEMGLLNPEDWKSQWIGFDLNHLGKDIPFKGKKLHLPPAPYLRKTIRLRGKVKKARLYATALGLYELAINGERVGKDYFAPGWTDYNKRVYYNTYDVTNRLQQGANVLSGVLSYGWYSGYIGYALLVGNPVVRAFYGEVPLLRSQLEVTYTDGKTEIFGTDTSWKAAAGPLLESDLLHGETYDARREQANWQKPDFNDGSWQNTRAYSIKAPLLQCYPGQTVQITQELKPRSVKAMEKGKFIVDMGQNFAGLVKLKVKGMAGEKVVLRFGEMLHPDGSLMTENLRLARATDTYILKGDPKGEEWTPRFTYHGFQFVEVSGFPGTLSADNLTGLVLGSNTPRVGTFACSDPMVNQLYSNIVWTQRANFLEIPTDCPQRDERLGWTGDAQIYGGTSALNMDVAAFFTKWLVDLHDAQWPSGAYPEYAPAPSVRSTDTFSPGWMEAGIINPYEVYRAYGDTRVIEKGWPYMEKFMAFHEARSKGRYFYPEASFEDVNPKGGFGDWLSVGRKTPPDMLATLYFGYTASLMAEMAQATGKTDRAQHYGVLAEKVRQAFQKHYIGPDGRFKTNAAAYGNGAGYVIDAKTEQFDGHTQTAYANAIYMNFLTPELQKQAGAHLAQLVKENGNKLSTGFLGVKQLLPALSATGNVDMAYQLLLNKEYPSWGFEVENGATSIWERWNSYIRDDPKQASINAAMNSFSHYAFGSVYEWMFKNMAGIRPDQPGYKTFIVKPEIPKGKITFAKASLRSIQGDIVSSWKREGNTLSLEVQVPVNTTASIYIPATAAGAVKESNKPLQAAAGLRVQQYQDGYLVVKAGSGNYRFESVMP